MDKKSDQDRSHLGVVLDPNVKIQPGKEMLQYLESEHSPRPFKDKTYLSIGDIKELYANVQKERKIYINDLLRESDIILPGLVVPTRNPELENRIKGLRNLLAQKEYNKMTRNVDLTNRYKPEDSLSFQIKQINSGMIGVFQFVVSVATAFMFGFMGIEVFSSVSFELAVKLLLGIICALIVACAELYFLVRALDIAEAPTEHIPPPAHNRASSSSLKSHLKRS